VSIAGTNLLYTPAALFRGTVILNYTISDGFGGSDTALVTVTVTPVNHPPVAVDDTATTPEDTVVTIPVLANDSDVDGDSLTITSATTTNGSVSVVGTNLFYTPAASFSGTAVLHYAISDGQGGTASAKVTVTVTPVNHPPVAVDDTATTPEDTVVTIPVLANDSDPDGDPLTITGATATNGTVSVAGTNLVYLPATNYHGTAMLQYSISDGRGGAASAQVTVTVTPVNHPPVAVDDFAGTTRNQPVTIAPLLNDSDPDGDPLTIIAATATNGTVNIVNGTNVLYTPASNYVGSATIAYTIADPSNATASAFIYVSVRPFNQDPVAVNDTATTPEDTAVLIPVLANDSDPDGDALTITNATTTNGTVTIVGTNLLYTPAAFYRGVVTLQYSISDGFGGAASALVTVTVTPVNHPPVAVDDLATTPHDTSVTIPVLANDSDPDGDPLTITSASTTNGVVSVAGTNLLYIPAAGFRGRLVLHYSISDGQGGAASALVTVTVTPLNLPPVAVNDSFTLGKNTSLTVAAPGVLGNDTDPDNDPLTAARLTDPLHGTLAFNSDGSFTYTPASNYFGADSFTYAANDGLTNSPSATVNLTITNINRAPVAANDSYTLGKNTSLTVAAPGVLANDTDLDGDILTAVKLTDPLHGTLTLNSNGSFTYTPASNYFGADSFTYEANDGLANSQVATVSLTITNINRAPVAADDNYTLGMNTVLAIPAPGVLANDTDADGNTLTALPSGLPNHGTVALAPNGGFTYTPATNYVGTDSFTYQASDGLAASALATVRLTITNAPPPPAQFGIRTGRIVFNPQTGLFEEAVTVTNTGAATVPAVRLLVGGLRTNVYLYNAAGTNGGRAFVQYNAALNPAQTVQFMLEFSVRDRRAFTNTLEAQAVSPTLAAANSTTNATGVAIRRSFIDLRDPNSPRFVIEFPTIKGRVYTVLYSDDLAHWSAATPTITATATVTQWYDDGPPKTSAKPLANAARYYRVVVAPAPTAPVTKGRPGRKPFKPLPH
jgi:VCBS repeat-containing protein